MIDAGDLIELPSREWLVITMRDFETGEIRARIFKTKAEAVNWIVRAVG